MKNKAIFMEIQTIKTISDYYKIIDKIDDAYSFGVLQRCVSRALDKLQVEMFNLIDQDSDNAARNQIRQAHAQLCEVKNHLTIKQNAFYNKDLE